MSVVVPIQYKKLAGLDAGLRNAEIQLLHNLGISSPHEPPNYSTNNSITVSYGDANLAVISNRDDIKA